MLITHGNKLGYSFSVRICGSHPSNTKLVAAERKFDAQMVAPGASPMGGEPTSPKLNVYWHVVSKDDTLEGGNVP